MFSNSETGGRVSDKALKILCVDDEPDLLEALSLTLGSIGFEVLTASGIEDGLAIIAREGDRLVGVVSDLAMPGGGGLELRRRLVELNSSLPFLVLSGNIDEASRANAASLNISTLLEKPFRGKHLVETVKRETQNRVDSIREDDELLQGFVAEARALVEEMEQLVLRLEETRDAESLNRMFACAHTIKGASGYFRPDTLHRFTHRFEDYVQQVKSGTLPLDATSIGVSLRAIDTIQKLLEDLDTGLHRQGLVDLEYIFDFKAKASGADTAPAAQRAPESSANTKQNELRVSIDLLESFMERSGEVTVLRHMINKVLTALEPDNRDNANFTMLTTLLSEMHKANGQVQDQIADLRKVPLLQVLRPLGRVLRDLCANLSKSIRLEITGEDIRVDHKIAAALGNCLVHLLRNSADHGIEMPAQRVAAGKPDFGTVRLDASTLDGNFILRIRDDGRGIDAAVIRRKAIEKGLIADAAVLTSSETLELIFHPGFSTAEQVSDVSGRGVGADMVRTTVLDLGGSITIESEVGRGTEFTIILPEPKSVLIAAALVVKVGGQNFAIPRDKLERVISIEVDDRRLRKIGEADVLQEAKAVTPIVRMRNLFGLNVNESLNDRYLVCLQTSAGPLAIEVDQVFEIEEIVIKRLGSWTGGHGLYNGATFLGDGRVSLVLDPEGIVRHLKLEARKVAAKSKVPVVKPEVAADWLLFKLADQSVYSIDSKMIDRVERVEPDAIQPGRILTMIYQNTVLPVYSLDVNQASAKAARDPVTILVMQVEAKRFGLVVTEVLDLQPLDLSDESLRIVGGKRCVALDGHTVTLLESEFLQTVAAG